MEKSKLAERTGLVHQKADELFRAADHLRFRLLLDDTGDPEVSAEWHRHWLLILEDLVDFRFLPGFR